MSNDIRQYSLILKLIFNKFSYPKESRFVKFFSENKDQEDVNPKRTNYKSLNSKNCINMTNQNRMIF